MAAVLRVSPNTASHLRDQSGRSATVAPPGPATLAAHPERQSDDAARATLLLDTTEPPSLESGCLLKVAVIGRTESLARFFDDQLRPVEVGQLEGVHESTVLVACHDAVELFGHIPDVWNERFTQNLGLCCHDSSGESRRCEISNIKTQNTYFFNKNNTRMGARVKETLAASDHQCSRSDCSLICGGVVGCTHPGLGSWKFSLLRPCQFSGFFGSAVIHHQPNPVHGNCHEPMAHFNAEQDIAVQNVPSFALAKPCQCIDIDFGVLLVETLKVAGCPSQVLALYEFVKPLVVFVEETFLQMSSDFFQIVIERICKVRHFWHGNSLIGGVQW